jgi:hypothetical protein
MENNEDIKRLLVELLQEQRQTKASLQEFRTEQQIFNERAEKRLLALESKSRPRTPPGKPFVLRCMF